MIRIGEGWVNWSDFGDASCLYLLNVHYGVVIVGSLLIISSGCEKLYNCKNSESSIEIFFLRGLVRIVNEIFQ